MWECVFIYVSECVCVFVYVSEWVCLSMWVSVFVMMSHVYKAWICSAEKFLELYGKVEAVVKNCLLRWSGHLFEVPSTHLFDQCFSFKHISLFYDTLNISGHWRRFSTVSVKSPTNFAQRLYIRVEVLLRAANLRHGTHGFTSLLKEFILRIFKLWKNPSTPAGLEVVAVDLCFTTLFNMLGHQRRFRHRAWKVRQILLRGSNFGLRFFYVP